MGPKLLVSDMSTADRKVLRWQLRVNGNNAVEFGVVPVAVQVRGWVGVVEVCSVWVYVGCVARLVVFGQECAVVWVWF